jgi:hypothetical protein
MPITLAFGRLRQEDHKFEISLGYIVKLCLTNPESSEVLFPLA